MKMTIFLISTFFFTTFSIAATCEVSQSPWRVENRASVIFSGESSVILVDKLGKIHSDYSLVKLHDSSERAAVAGAKMFLVVATGSTGFMVTTGEVLPEPIDGNYITVPFMATSEGKSIGVAVDSKVRLDCSR